MVLLAFALCLTPITNKPINNNIIAAAGRLIIPPKTGAFVNASGRGMPSAVRAFWK